MIIYLRKKRFVQKRTVELKWTDHTWQQEPAMNTKEEKTERLHLRQKQNLPIYQKKQFNE